MTDKEFEDAINGVGQFAPKPKFGGTGRVGKASSQDIWASNRSQYKEEAGEFGKQLAKWVKNERENRLLVNKEDIIDELRKENRYNGK